MGKSFSLQTGLSKDSKLAQGRPSAAEGQHSSSSSPTVAGCRLGGNILLDVIGGVESALWEGCYPASTLAPTCGATGVYERWCSSTLHIGWGLCDSLCLVLVCRGRYGLGGLHQDVAAIPPFLGVLLGLLLPTDTPAIP